MRLVTWWKGSSPEVILPPGHQRPVRQELASFMKHDFFPEKSPRGGGR